METTTISDSYSLDSSSPRRCSTAENQRRSPLLRLPTELWNKIQEYIFEGVTALKKYPSGKIVVRTISEDVGMIRAKGHVSSTDSDPVVQNNDRADKSISTAANQPRSRLLRLPGEIRNRVYAFAFSEENHTKNALLKTCVQIEHETKPI
ncbi:hypothetical protein G6011_02914 [Alternaria panax]|uniref:Uncharacterized protein n=1 Tax=Alternaria panax TaxID=48097 RepID=A0AAD4I5C8_9PLEO|nr:hypothetical protein G6011_02914 [Alternaria panax]